MDTMKKMSNLWRRAGSALLVLAMLAALAPAVLAEGTDVTVYLKPSEDWLQGSARFAEYYFQGDVSGWADLSADSEGYYGGSVPAGATIIFCRMNPGASENNWDNKWNQTGNLTIPSDGKNCFYQPQGTWDNADDSNWGVKGIVPEEPEPKPEGYCVAGDPGLCGDNWAADKNPMTQNDHDIWEITFPGVSAGTYGFKVTDGTWSNAWGNADGGNFTITLGSTGDVTIYFNAETKQIQVETRQEPGDYTVQLHFLPGEGWDDTVNAWLWLTGGESIPGYEQYHTTWPGQAIDGNADHAGWYDLTVVTEDAQGFWFIFNDGKNQTRDLYSGALTGNLELWYVGEELHTTAPEEWTGVPTYHYTIHYQNTLGWEAVNAYAWAEADQFLGTWPGAGISPNGENDQWYDVELTIPASAFEIIFNNGAGAQTGNLAVSAPNDAREVEVWITGETVSPDQPKGWNQAKAGNTVTLRFMPPRTSWGSKINAWLWAGAGDVPGYEEYHIQWPGKAVEADPDYPGWYKLEVTTELSAFSFIFNGNGRQTKDMTTGPITGDMELWVYGNEIYTSAPAVTPQTGDNSNPALYGVLLCLSALALAVVAGKKRAVK